MMQSIFKYSEGRCFVFVTPGAGQVGAGAEGVQRWRPEGEGGGPGVDLQPRLLSARLSEWQPQPRQHTQRAPPPRQIA